MYRDLKLIRSTPAPLGCLPSQLQLLAVSLLLAARPLLYRLRDGPGRGSRELEGFHPWVARTLGAHAEHVRGLLERLAPLYNAI